MMFSDGKEPNHWVDSYVHMLRKNVSVARGGKGEGG